MFYEYGTGLTSTISPQRFMLKQIAFVDQEKRMQKRMITYATTHVGQQLGIEVFNDDQCAMIHQGNFRGIKRVEDVYNDKALEILRKHTVDSRRVRFPAGDG